MNKSQANKPATISPQATYQDVLDAPPHKVAEIVDGQFYTHPRPDSPHAFAGVGLVGIINPSFQYGRRGPGGWWILYEPELHLSEDIVVPDIAGWRRERMPEFPVAAYFTLAPDWVCEVLSPSTRKLDLGGKKAVYAREGVTNLWFVDPIAHSLATYRLRGTKWVLIEKLFEDATVSLPPFEAISFSLGDLWLPQRVHKGTPRRPSVESEFEAIGASK